MSCERFDLDIRRNPGERILREGQGAIEIEEGIKWLRHENAWGARNIYGPQAPSLKRATSARADTSAERECRLVVSMRRRLKFK
jgi:hypothetical protein